MFAHNEANLNIIWLYGNNLHHVLSPSPAGDKVCTLSRLSDQIRIVFDVWHLQRNAPLSLQSALTNLSPSCLEPRTRTMAPSNKINKEVVESSIKFEAEQYIFKYGFKDTILYNLAVGASVENENDLRFWLMISSSWPWNNPSFKISLRKTQKLWAGTNHGDSSRYRVLRQGCQRWHSWTQRWSWQSSPCWTLH